MIFRRIAVFFCSHASHPFLPLIHANLSHPGKGLMMRGQKPFGALGIRAVCWMHEHAQQEPIHVNPIADDMHG